MNERSSAILFDTRSRIHIGLAVADRERSVDFYRLLLGVEPTKIRPGYARFETAEPPLNLSLIEGTGSRPVALPDTLHYGIQVKSTDEVERMAARLQEAGLPALIEEQRTCCHALQTKVWATDPDGNPWEVFVVLHDDPAQSSDTGSACCTNGRTECCDMAAHACC